MKTIICCIHKSWSLVQIKRHIFCTAKAKSPRKLRHIFSPEHFKGGSPLSECESRDWRNSLANVFFWTPFEANEKFCLLNKFNLFTNQKQSLKCARQKIVIYTSDQIPYILSDKEKCRLEELMSKQLKWNLSKAFLIALTSTQKLHCRTTIFAEALTMTASALKHDHDVIIIKSAKSLKLFWYQEVAGRWIEIKIC